MKKANAADWANYIAPVNPLTIEMRYSAEIATILKFAKHELTGNKTIVEFLSEYETVFFHDSDETSKSCIAANHMAVYLQKIIDNTDVKKIYPYPF